MRTSTIALAIFALVVSGPAQRAKEASTAATGYQGQYASTTGQSALRSLNGATVTATPWLGRGAWLVRADSVASAPIYVPGPGPGKAPAKPVPGSVRGPHVEFIGDAITWRIPIESDGDAAAVFRLVTGETHDELRGGTSENHRRTIARSSSLGPAVAGLRIGAVVETRRFASSGRFPAEVLIVNTSAKRVELELVPEIGIGQAWTPLQIIEGRELRPGDTRCTIALDSGARIHHQLDLGLPRWKAKSFGKRKPQQVLSKLVKPGKHELHATLDIPPVKAGDVARQVRSRAQAVTVLPAKSEKLDKR